MKKYWGSGGKVTRIFNFGTRWGWLVSFTAQPLYSQGNTPWYRFDRRIGGP